MIYGNIKDPRAFRELQGQPWEKAFSWIDIFKLEKPDGKFEIAKEMFANVFTTETTDRLEGKYELHKSHIDIHYCLTGGELIESATIKLELAKQYDPQEDAELYNPPEQKGNQIIMKPGDFAVFFPNELHLPKIFDGTNKTVRKLVIKIKK